MQKGKHMSTPITREEFIELKRNQELIISLLKPKEWKLSRVAVNISDVCHRRRAHIKGLKFEIVEADHDPA